MYKVAVLVSFCQFVKDKRFKMTRIVKNFDVLVVFVALSVLFSRDLVLRSNTINPSTKDEVWITILEDNIAVFCF